MKRLIITPPILVQTIVLVSLVAFCTPLLAQPRKQSYKNFDTFTQQEFPPTSQETTVQKWQYIQRSYCFKGEAPPVFINKTKDELAMAGSFGWELAGIIQTPWYGNCFVGIYKRPLR